MEHSKRKMLYIMHVSWYWIKQRPHFLAENLNEYFDVTILYKKSLTDFLTRSTIPNNCIGIFQFPLSRFQIIAKLNRFIYRQYVKKYLKNVDCLWMSSAIDYSSISDIIDIKLNLVYDCMDDVCEFPKYKKEPEASKIINKEKKFVERANNIIVSSNWLKQVIYKRYGIKKNIHLINNAIDQNFLHKNLLNKEISYPLKKAYVDIMYIGTISEWLNFEIIQKALDDFSELRLILIGPLGSEIPTHNRIIHLGAKAHVELPLFMAKADALIMPFIVNDLILSVNPVKLYEYIFAGKPVITCNYKEIEQFNEFVYAYNDDEDFLQLINNLMLGNLSVKSKEERTNFLKINSWKERSLDISKIILRDF
ncbi:glycosyltransferase [uncultured Tenacibaculum sp.]|uniref:glycosyltransferase n=1 Tax=uncultured Tenacibaculum sp. TaxID=174713 RepID=UPI00260471CA|nr:glycosyltransferase [uncultured Tenacibaculum sp.]